MGLRYTVEGSYLENDMQVTPILMTSEHRPAQVPISDEENYFGLNASLQLALGMGELKLTSTDPRVQPFLDYNYLTDPFDRERMRKAVRLCAKLGDSGPFQEMVIERVTPTDDELASDEALDAWLMKNTGTSHPYLMYVQDRSLVGPDGRGGPVRQGAWHGGAKGCRCVGDARLHPRQHQRHHHNDCGEDR